MLALLLLCPYPIRAVVLREGPDGLTAAWQEIEGIPACGNGTAPEIGQPCWIPERSSLDTNSDDIGGN